MAVVGSLEGLRELNKLRIVDALRQLGTASRTELARHTGLSRARPSRRSSPTSRPAASSSRTPRAARSQRRVAAARVLRLDASAGAAVGVDFGHSHVHVAVADLASRVLAERRVAVEVDDDATTALNTAAESSPGRRLDRPRPDADRLRRDGRAGAVRPANRRDRLDGDHAGVGRAPCRRGASRGGSGCRSRSTTTPTSARSAALLRRCARPHRLHLRQALLRDRRRDRRRRALAPRRTGFAGELGHVRVPDEVAVCRCGNRGCLQRCSPRPIARWRSPAGRGSSGDTAAPAARSD